MSEASALEFYDQMNEVGALVPSHEASADAVRHAHRAEIHQRIEDGRTGRFTISDVGQETAGMTIPTLRLALEPLSAAYDSPLGTTSTLATRVPQGTQAYRAFLAYFELPSHAWECSPIEVAQQYSDRIEDRTIPFHYQTGFVVELHENCSVEPRDGSGIDRYIGKDEAEEDRYGGSGSPRLHGEL